MKKEILNKNNIITKKVINFILITAITILSFFNINSSNSYANEIEEHEENQNHIKNRPISDKQFQSIFSMVKAKEVNVRIGPGDGYPVVLKIKSKPFPVLIKSEYEDWVLIWDGANIEGWIKKTFVSSKKRIGSSKIEGLEVCRLPISYKSNKLRRRCDVIALLEKGAIFDIILCRNGHCRIRIDKTTTGWIPSRLIWGVFEREKI